jgi:hypothetical protein
VEVSLVDGRGGRVAEANLANNFGYLAVPVGLPADEFGIFFLSNPFGAHTPQSAAFRTVLDLLGAGAVLNLADAADRINRGDTGGLFTLALSQVKGKVLERAAAAGGSLGNAASTYCDLALVEQVTSLAVGQGPLAGLEDFLVARLAASATAPGGRMVVLVGDGSQTLIDVATGEPLPVVEDRITGTADSCSLKRGGISVYLVPESVEVEARHATRVTWPGR